MSGPVAQLLGRSQDSAPASEDAAPASDNARVRMRSVLIIDDDPAGRVMVGVCLEELGLVNPQLGLSSGQAAIAELQRLSELGPDHLPALMVLDWKMPKGTGLDVLHWLETHPLDREVPVVMLTSNDALVAVVDAYALGVRSFLVKPVGFDALAAVVAELGLPWLLT
jgi:CheY-like chemotaxis protein